MREVADPPPQTQHVERPRAGHFPPSAAPAREGLFVADVRVGAPAVFREELVGDPGGDTHLRACGHLARI